MRLKPRRLPDEVIGGTTNPYLERWHICRNKFFNIYLHHVIRSDDDRALHDHPWWNVSIVLQGGYYEEVPVIPGMYAYGWRHTKKTWRGVGSVIYRKALSIHRLIISPYAPKETWTLFITGPKIREWGFWCPSGWKHWRVFCNVPVGEATHEEIGPGC